MELGTEFELLPQVLGRGRFLGVVDSVMAYPELRDSWRGEVKVYLDGDATGPTLTGTGTEDYLGAG